MESKSSSGIRVILNSIIYSCSGLLLKCFSFFLLPLYTTYLTTEDYGISSVITTFVTTASYIVAFSLFAAILRFYVDLKDDEKKLKRFYGTIVTFVFLSSVIFSIILSILREPVTKYLFSGIDYFPLVFVGLISLVFSCQHTIFENILKSQQKALKSSLFSIIFFFLSVALNILFVVGMKLGAMGTLLATLVSYALYSLYFLIEMCFTGKIEICIDLQLLKSALKYSIPIMPHNLSTQIALFLSKIFISGSGSMADLGIYSVAAQFGNISDTIQSYVDSAYGPWLYEKLHNKEKSFKEVIRSNANLLISCIGLFFIGISLFAQDYIVLFIDESYVDAWKYVPLIISVFAIKTAYYFFVEVLFYFKAASRKLFWATLSSSFVNILLSYYFIPIWNVYGSILADAISMLLRTVIVIIISKQYENIGLKVFDFIKNFLVVESFIILGLFFSITKYQTTFSILNFGYKILITLLYVAIAFIMNRKTVTSYFEQWKEKRQKKHS